MELCRKHGVSDASIYNWREKLSGLDVSEAKRLKTLEDENAKLKRLLADAMLGLYRKAKLTVRKRGGWKRAIGTPAPILVPRAANDRLSLDFVSGQLTDGRMLRVPAIVDDCTRECLGNAADTSPPAYGLHQLDRIIEGRGKPKMIVSENFSAFTGNAILQ